MQYTIRDIPKDLDSALRQASKRFHKSLNQIAVEALVKGANLEGKIKRYNDLDTFFGSWTQDPEFEKSLQASYCGPTKPWVISISYDKATSENAT